MNPKLTIHKTATFASLTEVCLRILPGSVKTVKMNMPPQPARTKTAECEKNNAMIPVVIIAGNPDLNELLTVRKASRNNSNVKNTSVEYCLKQLLDEATLR